MNQQNITDKFSHSYVAKFGNNIINNSNKICFNLKNVNNLKMIKYTTKMNKKHFGFLFDSKIYNSLIF